MIEWIDGFVIFSLIICCCRNEFYIRQIRKESVPNIWQELMTLHKNDSTNHSIQPTSKITYTWKDEVEYNSGGVSTSTSGGICTSLGSTWDSSGGKFRPSKPEPPQYFPDIPTPTMVLGKPSMVYSYDYLPLNELLDLILEHIEMKPTRIPRPEEPKLFGLKRIDESGSVTVTDILEADKNRT